MPDEAQRVNRDFRVDWGNTDSFLGLLETRVSTRFYCTVGNNVMLQRQENYIAPGNLYSASSGESLLGFRSSLSMRTDSVLRRRSRDDLLGSF